MDGKTNTTCKDDAIYKNFHVGPTGRVGLCSEANASPQVTEIIHQKITMETIELAYPPGEEGAWINVPDPVRRTIRQKRGNISERRTMVAYQPRTRAEQIQFQERILRLP